MFLSPSILRPICFLNLFLVLCHANVASRTKSSPIQDNAEVSGTVELDSKPVAVSDELMYKSGTDERLSAAEKAFGGGNKMYASKEEELKDIYEFNTFYNPDKWEQMLDDTDYEELDQEMRKIKSARWKTKKADEEELDVEEDESTDDVTADVDGSQEFDDEDYQALDVPAVQVQLDAQWQETAHRHSQEMGQANQAALSDEEKSARTAEKLASWMDIVGGDPEFTRQDEETDKDKNAASFDLYNLFSSNRPEAKEETAGQVVVEGESKKVDLLDFDNDDKEDKEKLRQKRSYQSFDDDYSSALAFDGETDEAEGRTQKKDKHAGNGQLDDDDEELIENEQTFDEDDYATSKEKDKEDQKQDIGEEEDAAVLDMAAKNEIDKEYDDVSADKQKGMAAGGHSRLVHHDEKGQTRRYRTKVKDRKGRDRVKNTQVRDVRHRYELNDPDDDSTRWLQVRHRRKDQWMDAAPRPHHRRRHNFDQDERTVAVSLGDHHQRTRRYHPRLAPKQELEKQQRFDDRRYDDDDGDAVAEATDSRSRRTSHQARKPSRTAKEETYHRHQSRDRTPRHSSKVSERQRERRNGAQSDVDSHEFSWEDLQQYDKQFAKGKNLDTDEDYEMDVGDGSIESRYGDVCNKVREEFREPRSGGLDGQSHPGVKFSGAFKKGEGQCDIFCQRTEGANSLYVLFHLKDWPCGPDKKGRCSLDGKCEETSREKKR